jgi:hypothetical protein
LWCVFDILNIVQSEVTNLGSQRVVLFESFHEFKEKFNSFNWHSIVHGDSASTVCG